MAIWDGGSPRSSEKPLFRLIEEAKGSTADRAVSSMRRGLLLSGKGNEALRRECELCGARYTVREDEDRRALRSPRMAARSRRCSASPAPKVQTRCRCQWPLRSAAAIAYAKSGAYLCLVEEAGGPADILTQAALSRPSTPADGQPATCSDTRQDGANLLAIRRHASGSRGCIRLRALVWLGEFRRKRSQR